MPIDAYSDEIRHLAKRHSRLVLTADPGAGKSTRVPFILKSPSGKTLIAQPRRLATTSLAHFLSAQRAQQVGESIGYRVRFDSRLSDKTWLEFVTDGLLVKLILEDPELQGISTVILDEFHERTQFFDFALALLLEIQAVFRPDLQIIVMSATLNADQLSEHMDAPHLHIPAEVYSNEITYVDTTVHLEKTAPHVSKAVLSMLGDVDSQQILVFLPGLKEIRAVASALAHQTSIRIAILHGRQTPHEQNEVTQFTGEQIILATNVAETSITLPCVNRVVDSGWHRIGRYQEGWTTTALFTQRVSRFSAIQRAGRANRMGPGKTIRLWTQAEDLGLVESDAPGILRDNLDRLYLDALAWGALPESLKWLTPPEVGPLTACRTRLVAIGAINKSGLTSAGRRWQRSSYGPKLSKVLEQMGELSDEEFKPLLWLIPLLDGESVPGKPHEHLLEKIQNLPPRHRYRQSVRRFSKRLNRLQPPPPTSLELEKNAVAALLAGFPERLAQRRSSKTLQYKLQNGTGAHLSGNHGSANSAFIFALNLGGIKAKEATIFEFITVKRDAVPFTESTKLFFNPQNGRVAHLVQMSFGALSTDERPQPLPDEPELIAKCLAEGIAAQLETAFTFDIEYQQLLARLCFAREHGCHLPTLLAPEPQSVPDKALINLCYGRKSVKELRDIPLAKTYLGSLTYHESQALERYAPEHLELENGVKRRLTYTLDHGPVLSCRFEWLFGMSNSPTLNGHPIRLELLAPNMRPVQVTTDLPSFWASGYPQIRKDMRGRYPKHPWPEDPIKARPGTSRRKKTT